MKEQKVVRTYPTRGYGNPTLTLEKALASGWTVVHVNSFYLPNNEKGNEYILERKLESEE